VSVALPLFLGSSLGLDDPLLQAGLWLGLVPFVLGLFGSNVALAALASGRTTPARARVGLLLVLFAELASFVRYGLPIDWELLRLGVTALFVGGALLAVARRDRLAGGLAGAALAVQVGVLFIAPNRLPATLDPFVAEPPHIRFLRERLGEASANGRILGTRGHLHSNASSAFGIAELSALLPVQAESAATYIMTLMGEDIFYLTPFAWNGMLADAGPLSWAGYLERRPYYNVLNVRYLVDVPNGPLSQRPVEGLHLVHEDIAFWVYQDAAALPRAYTIDRATAVADVADATRILREPGVDPRSGVVVELPPEELPLRMRRAGVAEIRPATIQSYAAEAVDIQVDAPDPVLLVLADAYYRGWTATVDGELAPIRRVNLALRGLVLPAGQHAVSFRYQVAQGWEGLLTSGTSSMVALALLASGLVAGRRRRSCPRGTIGATPASPLLHARTRRGRS
jgi:hypothetical protein